MLGLDCMCCISQLRSATWDHAGGTQAQCAIHGTKKLGIAVSCITGHITPVFEVLAVTRAHSNISRRSASPRNFVLVASLSLRRSASGSSTVDNMYAATELLISSNSLLNPGSGRGQWSNSFNVKPVFHIAARTCLPFPTSIINHLCRSDEADVDDGDACDSAL